MNQFYSLIHVTLKNGSIEGTLGTLSKILADGSTHSAFMKDLLKDKIIHGTVITNNGSTIFKHN